VAEGSDLQELQGKRDVRPGIDTALIVSVNVLVRGECSRGVREKSLCHLVPIKE
jgi:hypothetical protein